MQIKNKFRYFLVNFNELDRVLTTWIQESKTKYFEKMRTKKRD